MDLTLLHFILVCPLVFLAGFVDAIAGGGGLISLPAYLLAGLPVHMATATNKMSSSMGTALTTWRFARSGFINWRLAPLCLLCAFTGGVSGANLALLIDARIFRLLMLIILPLTGLYVLRSQSLNRPPQEQKALPQLSQGRVQLLAALAALLIGIYDGFYGPGTGTFLILLLTALAHLPLTQANGLTKLINLTTNLSSLLMFLQVGMVLLPLGLTAGCFNIAGNYLGARCFTRRGAQIARPIILLVLTIFFITTLWQVGSEWFLTGLLS